MTLTATLLNIEEKQDGTIIVTWPNGFGTVFANRDALQSNVDNRLVSAVDSLNWLLLNDYLVKGSTSGQCLLNTDDVNGNWVKKI
jgi:hypothetical protein